MAKIVVAIPDIAGESAIAGHVNKVEAIGIRQQLESGGAGTPRHGDIELIRVKDKASPKLAEKCAAGVRIDNASATVKISLLRNTPMGWVEYLTTELDDVYVSRIEHDILDQNRTAYQPHLVPSGPQAEPPSYLGLASFLKSFAFGQADRARVAARPAVASPWSAAGDVAVERIWLNPASVIWTYVGPAGSNIKVQGGWDIKQGQLPPSLAAG